MQESQENLSLSVTPANGIVSQNPVMPLGLVAPYHQQANDINHMLQILNQMTRELCSQLSSLEERAVFFMRVKDKVIEEMKKQSVEMEIRLTNALAEADFWRKMSVQKTDLCKDLAGRLLKVKKREMSTKVIAERNVAYEAESSTGDNGDDVLDTARTRLCKRRRL